MEAWSDEILAVSYGGTIAMEEVVDFSARRGIMLRPSPRLRRFSSLINYLQLSGFVKDARVRFVSIPVSNLDSNNLHPPLWRASVETVRDQYIQHYEKTGLWYKAAFQTLGTDTKEYFAPANAAGFGSSVNFPNMFGSAQSEPRRQVGDARQVVARSIGVIQFTDQVGNLAINGDRILEASRLVKISENRYDYLDSDMERGRFINGQIRIAANMSMRRKPEVPPFNPKDILTCFSDNVLAVKAIPGFRPDVLIPVLPNINGLMIIPNGAGNLSDYEAYSFKPLLEEAKKINLPVLVPSPFSFGSSDSSDYEAGKIVHDMGCLTNNGLTIGAATAMFYLAIGQAEIAMHAGIIQRDQRRAYIAEKIAEPRFALPTNPYITYQTEVQADRPVGNARAHKRTSAGRHASVQ